MKVTIYSDPHWCQNSSIVRSRGSKYSLRLENLVESVNWVEQLAWDTASDCIICCGDFFDSSVLNSEEISALQEIRWAPISHLFLTGNHETNVSSLEYSTTDLFKLCPNSCVMSTPQQYFIDNTSVEFCFLPYVVERDRKPLIDYFGKQTCNRVIFSHNDIKNVQYGSFLSKEGFEVEEIEDCCNLYFNGHIHHCCNVTDKIFNIGNLTGQNFTEDALKYSHCAVVLDTETLEYKLYQNPHSLKFYKIDASHCTSIDELSKMLSCLNYNAVATIHVDSSIAAEAKSFLDGLKTDLNHVVEYRLILKHKLEQNYQNIVDTSCSVDHLQKFKDYVMETYENNDILLEELNNILR